MQSRLLLLFLLLLQLFWYPKKIYSQFFNVPTTFDSLATEGVLRLYDIDNDGDNDVLWSDGTSGSRIGIYENLGDGTWNTISLGTTSGSAVNIVHFDLDNDGLDEIFVAGWNGNEVKWYKNWGNNVFTPMDSSNAVVQPYRISFIDKNNDGIKDMSVTGRTGAKWFRNSGLATFDSIIIESTYTSSFSGFQGSTNKGTDFNGDGLDDQLWTDKNKGPFIKINDGLGGYYPQEHIIDNNFIISDESAYFYKMIVSSGDIDLDGDIDIICYNSRTPLVYYENINNSLHFIRHVILDSDSVFLGRINFLLLDDIENDGDLDLLFCNDGGYGKYSLNFNNSLFQYQGKTYYDENQNGVFDVGEKGLNFIDLSLDSTRLKSSVNNDGNYIIPSENGSHRISYIPDSLWILTSNSSSYIDTLTSESPVKSNLDFGFYPSIITDVIESDFVGGFPRCNSIVNYWFDFSNYGTTTPSFIVKLDLDSSLQLVNSIITPDSTDGNSSYWFVDSLSFNTQQRFNIQVQMPTWQNMGNTMVSVVNVIKIDSLGNLSSISADTLTQKLVCAYDPNDKIVSSGIGPEGYVSNNQELEYTIRFQNTGTDTAINVLIIDSISTMLDINQIELISSSHPCQMKVDKYQNTYFVFKNIMLPDSNVNEIKSHGYVKFRIMPLDGLEPETQIQNFAEIYFDLNPPVITDTTLNTIFDCNRINVTILQNNGCKGENIAAYVLEKYTNSFVWSIDSIQIENNDTLIFSPQHSGIQILQLETSNEICKKDTAIIFELYPQYLTKTTMSICNSDSILLYGSYINTPGVYYDTLQTINGCDSVLQTNLTVLPEKYLFENVSICHGDSIYLEGSYQTKQGLYIDSTITITGCDSLLYRNLNIRPIQKFIANPISICLGDSILIAGEFQDQSGQYIDTLQSIYGCDSLIYSYLSVSSEVITLTQSATICSGDSIQIGGLFYKSSGIYDDTLQTVLGCDSILKYLLHVNELPDVQLYEFSDDTLCIESPNVDLPFVFPPEGTYSGNGVLNDVFSPALCDIGKQTLFYQYTDNNGCTGVDSTTITLVGCAGIPELGSSTDGIASLVPNPFQEDLTITIGGDISFPYRIEVTDIYGRNTITIEDINAAQVTIKKSTLPKGVYFVYIIDSKGDGYFIGRAVSE